MRNKLFILAAVLGALAGCESLPSWMGGDDKPEVKLPGERVSVLEYQRALEPDDTLLEESVNLMNAERNLDWRYETSVLAEGLENLVVTGLNEAESVTIGEGNEWPNILVSQPVVESGKLYAMDAAGYITAHNAGMLSQIYWESEVAVTEDEEPIQGGGLAVEGGVVYVTTGYGALMALVAEDGSLLWRQDVNVPIRAAPVVADGKLFATTIDNQLLAYDARTGKPQWSHRGIKETAVYLGAVSPAVENGIVIAAYTSGELYALRAEDGSVLWTDSLVIPKRTLASAALTGIDATPIIKNGNVYGLSNNGLMVADVLANGRGVWDMEISGYQTPWVGGDYLFMLTSDAQLVAVRQKDAAVRWSTSLRVMDDGQDVTPRYSGPILVNDKLIVVSDDGQMLIASPETGKIERRREVPDGIMTAPIVANGRLYLLSNDATLTAYE